MTFAGVNIVCESALMMSDAMTKCTKIIALPFKPNLFNCRYDNRDFQQERQILRTFLSLTHYDVGLFT